MNPFDLHGPQFLAFYAVLCAVTLGALVLLRRLRETDGTHMRLSDPYLIAYLRGGPKETLRLIVASLVDRGLLTSAGTLLEASSGAAEKTHHALERAILERFQRGAEASAVFGDLLLMHKATDLGRTLERHGLMADEEVRGRRRVRLRVALALLGGIALVKIFVALSRGHGNVGLLIAMAGLTLLIGVGIGHKPRTTRGDWMLADLRRLFAQLRRRAAQLGQIAHDEALLLAAVFGLGALPYWTFARALFPKAAKSEDRDGSWSSSGCGSSCGSSSGSSCGSSCGGGCGGGCGGCGS